MVSLVPSHRYAVPCSLAHPSLIASHHCIPPSTHQSLIVLLPPIPPSVALKDPISLRLSHPPFCNTPGPHLVGRSPPPRLQPLPSWLLPGCLRLPARWSTSSSAIPLTLFYSLLLLLLLLHPELSPTGQLGSSCTQRAAERSGRQDKGEACREECGEFKEGTEREREMGGGERRG